MMLLLFLQKEDFPLNSKYEYFSNFYTAIEKNSSLFGFMQIVLASSINFPTDRMYVFIRHLQIALRC